MSCHASRAHRLKEWLVSWPVLVLSICIPGRLLAQDFDDVEFYEPEFVRYEARAVLDSPEFRNVPRLDLGSDTSLAEPLKPKDGNTVDDDDDDVVTMRRPSPIGNFFAGLFGGAVSLAVVVSLCVILGAIILLAVFGFRRWERPERRRVSTDADAAGDDEEESLVSPSDKPADAWLAAARIAATAARFDEALALLLLGAMSHAERAGRVKPRRGLTYRDYLRAVPLSSPWHAALDRLIREYAPVGFGRRQATAEAFALAVEPYEVALVNEPASQVGGHPPATD